METRPQKGVRRFTEAGEALIRKRYPEGAPLEVIMGELRAIGENVPSQTWNLRQVISRMGLRRDYRIGEYAAREVRQEIGLQVVASNQGTDVRTDAEFLDDVVKRTHRAVLKTDTERFARVRIATDAPVAFTVSSDWHLSSTGACDVEAVLAYADVVRTTPGVYAFAVGDQLDNPIKHKPTSVDDIPDDVRLLDLVVGRFGGKLLGMTSGNHDDWSKQLAGTDHLSPLAKRHRIHYAPDEIVVVIELVEPADPETVTARYVGAMRHKYFRHSNLNFSHACWRWVEDNARNWPQTEDGGVLLPDFAAIAHNHVASTETRRYEDGRACHALRMGSLQRPSRYTKAGGWARMAFTTPTVIMFPGDRKTLAFDMVEDALTHLKGLTSDA